MSEEAAGSRESRRVNVNYPAVFKNGSGSVDGVIKQISSGGGLFVSSRPLDIRTTGIFTMRVFSGEPEIVFEGEVIYHMPVKDGQEVVEHGMRFILRDPAQADVIARVIRYATVKERYFGKC